MKKTMILAAAAAMFMFASCQKEEVIPVQDSQADELVFTATIDQSATKTTINTDGTSANKGKVSWEVNDSISVTDGADTAVYYIAEVGDIAADGSATFTYKSGDRPSSTASSYTATYGDAITAAQTYSATAGKLPMAGVSDSGDKTKLNFTVTCGLLKLNLAASGENTKDISRIEIVGRLTGAAKDTLFALTCDNESIESANDFYIALPAGSYNLMKFINSKGSVCFKKATTAMAIEANKIQPVTLSGITFSAVLPGKFTVASGKQVQFSAANLWCNTSASPVTYSLESAQNATYATLGQSSYTASHVCHFFWTSLTDYQSGNASYMPYASSYSYSAQLKTDKFWCGVNNPMTVDGQSNLYALTGGNSGEWNYLFNSRTNASTLYTAGVSVTTSAGTVANCLVIAPDACLGGYTFDNTKTSYTAAEWAAAEAGGLVCLPAAGFCVEEELQNAGKIYYWSASPSETQAFGDKSGVFSLAYCFYYVKSLFTSAKHSRGNGYSVRLVYSAAPASTTGTAMAQINGLDVEVAWVQLWANGPKFAVKNVGADANTDNGSTLKFSDATETGADYEWGSNWKTPTKDEMDLLNTSKVSCTYCQESGVWGFKFTGVQEGYTGNSLFLPADNGDSNYGDAGYWSSTSEDSNAWSLSLNYSDGSYSSDWGTCFQSEQYFVRPVLSI